MPRWQEFARSLTRPRAGFSADGRVLGLGLATAMDAQRKQAIGGADHQTELSADVAEFLRSDTQGRAFHG